MPYNIKHSDPTKDPIYVPDMPPGVNTVDTSLSLVGRGYPNYGEAFATNFIRLLENFASPIPPENPMEGQLWYDTSVPSKKVLRIMDGTATAARWPNATGIYQQNIDPKNSTNPGLKDGDIWVNTVAKRLSIYSNDDWITVGPSISNGTGAEASTIETSTETYNVIKNYANNVLISVISNEEFIPNPVINGFTTIKRGINLSSDVDSNRVGVALHGTANNATNVLVDGFPTLGKEFLLKNDYSNRGQVVKGHVVFSQSNAAATDGANYNNGVVIDAGISTEFIQLYKNINDAVLYNNKSGGSVVIRTKNSSGIATSSLTANSDLVSINAATTITGTLLVASTLTVSSSTSILGSASVGGNLAITSGLTIGGITTSTGKIIIGANAGSGVAIVSNHHNSYDIGTATNYFRSLYVSTIYASNVFSSNVVWPVGTLRLSVSDTAPTGWLKCDGSSKVRATYPELYSLIGNKYGTPISGNEFYIPNLFEISTTTGGTATSYYIIKT
jgi:hypothetical protein